MAPQNPPYAIEGLTLPNGKTVSVCSRCKHMRTEPCTQFWCSIGGSGSDPLYPYGYFMTASGQIKNHSEYEDEQPETDAGCSCDTIGSKTLAELFPRQYTPAAWQCPGCKHWKAPHVTECACNE